MHVAQFVVALKPARQMHPQAGEASVKPDTLTALPLQTVALNASVKEHAVGSRQFGGLPTRSEAHCSHEGPAKG